MTVDCGDALRPRGLLGVPYDNHLTSTHFPGPEPAVLVAQEKRKEEELIGCLVNSFTRWASGGPGG